MGKGLDDSNMGILKRVFIICLICLVALGGAGAFVKAQSDARFFDDYDPAAPLDVVLRESEKKADYRLEDLVFDGVPGLDVPTLLALPLEEDGPYPCIIFLHGIGQSRGFLEDIAAPYTKEGFAFVSFDQYTRGERKLDSENPLVDALALRRRCALNVIETRRLVDYLVTRSDIDADRIYLIGASFGAITGATAVAFEPRIAAAVMTYGGGDLRKLLSSRAIESELGLFHGVVVALVAYLTAPADPVKYVGQVAPRPLLFQNGTHDVLISNEAADAFFEAANEPKERTLYDSDHVGLDEEQTRAVLNESLDWIKRVDSERTTLGKDA